MGPGQPASVLIRITDVLVGIAQRRCLAVERDLILRIEVTLPLGIDTSQISVAVPVDEERLPEHGEPVFIRPMHKVQAEQAVADSLIKRRGIKRLPPFGVSAPVEVQIRAQRVCEAKTPLDAADAAVLLLTEGEEQEHLPRCGDQDLRGGRRTVDVGIITPAEFQVDVQPGTLGIMRVVHGREVSIDGLFHLRRYIFLLDRLELPTGSAALAHEIIGPGELGPRLEMIRLHQEHPLEGKHGLGRLAHF